MTEMTGSTTPATIFGKFTDGNPAATMLQLLHFPWVSQYINATVKLRIPDYLADGPKDSETLSQLSETHAPSLYRMLRALAGMGFFTEDEAGNFALTPLGHTLRQDIPDSVGNFLYYMAEPWHWQALSEIINVVRTGQSVYKHAYQMNQYEYLESNPTAGHHFNIGIKAWSACMHAAAVESYDFSGTHTLVDVGGGMGTLLIAILQKYPALQGIYFDQVRVAEVAKTHIEAAGLAERCRAVGGSFFESVPAGGDTYMISSVLMDWKDEEVITIFQHCRSVIPSDGKLLIVEVQISPRNEPCFGKILDIGMMADPEGRVRSVDEFARLLNAAGFEVRNNVATTLPSYYILEAVPI
jgi:hypothetical protein